MTETPAAAETTNPNPEPVTFQLSPEGAALRAQLDAKAGKSTSVEAQPTGPKKIEQLTPAEQRARESKQPLTVRSADGETVNLEDGTVTKGEPDAGDAYEVIPEIDMLPMEHHEEARQIAIDLEAVGHAHGLTMDRMQLALDAGGDLFLSAERELDLRTREQGISALNTRYGTEAAERIISEAQRMTNYLGPDFAAYMDQTGLGNSIAALNVLAAQFRGDLSLTPAAAKAKITELRKADNAMDRDVIDRVAILSRVANPKTRGRDAGGYSSRDTTNRITSTIGAHMTAAELRKELDALNDLKSDLHSRDGVKRQKAVKRRAQITAQLGAGA